MEFGKRHDTTDTTDFCPRQLVTDLLWTCYGETGVMDFGLNAGRHDSCCIIPWTTHDDSLYLFTVAPGTAPHDSCVNAINHAGVGYQQIYIR